ncbi:MAG: glycosyltransferase 87 family protein [Candidatus Eisenbacteria bacterium]
MTPPEMTWVEGGAAAPRWPRALELGALAAGMTLCFTLAGALPSWRAELGRLQALMAVAFVFLALALARMERYRALPHTGAFVIVVAFVLRAAVFTTTPSLSDDIYRYVWEGRVISHGQNPYAHAPADPVLGSLADPAILPRVNHPELSAIYPPVAEAGFALVATVSATVGAMKFWILLHEMALIALLARWCQKRSGSALGAIAYAWNPLVVVEYAGSGHHDPTALLWLTFALYWMERRPVGSALALSAAVLVKLVPLVAIPFLWMRWPWRARWVALGTIGPGLGAFAWLTRGEGSGLAAYAAHWRNNELFFHYLAIAFGDDRARWLAACLLVAFILIVLMRRVEALNGTRAAIGATLLLGPVLHPWYLGWALVFEPLRVSAPWLLLSALALLSYGVLSPPQEQGGFHLSLAWRWLEYGLPLALAAFLAGRHHRARGMTHVV